jgi:hypothetical protein
MAVVLGKCSRELLAGYLTGAQRKTTINGVAPVGAIVIYLYHVQHTHLLAPQPSGHEGGWDRQDEGVHIPTLMGTRTNSNNSAVHSKRLLAWRLISELCFPDDIQIFQIFTTLIMLDAISVSQTLYVDRSSYRWCTLIQQRTMCHVYVTDVPWLTCDVQKQCISQYLYLSLKAHHKPSYCILFCIVERTLTTERWSGGWRSCGRGTAFSARSVGSSASLYEGRFELAPFMWTGTSLHTRRSDPAPACAEKATKLWSTSIGTSSPVPWRWVI